MNIIAREQEFTKLSKRIEASVKQQIEKNQKEYFLREQIKAIRKELGENEETEADEFRTRLKKRTFPDEIRIRLEKKSTGSQPFLPVHTKHRPCELSSIVCWTCLIPR